MILRKNLKDLVVEAQELIFLGFKKEKLMDLALEGSWLIISNIQKKLKNLALEAHSSYSYDFNKGALRI